MLRIKLPQPRCRSHILCERRHVARMIYAVLDPSRLARQQPVMRLARWDWNFVEEEESPEHRLLFCDRGNSACARVRLRRGERGRTHRLQDGRSR